MQLVWRATALADLREVIGYISERDIAAAERLLSAVEGCAERLPELPFMYRPGRIAGTREAVVHPNYILVYRVTGEAVEVLSLVHARQQYP